MGMMIMVTVEREERSKAKSTYAKKFIITLFISYLIAFIFVLPYQFLRFFGAAEFKNFCM